MNTDTIDTLREDRDAILCQARNARVRGDDVEANELSAYAYRLTDRILDAEAKRRVECDVKVEPRETAEAICEAAGVPTAMADKMVVMTIS